MAGVTINIEALTKRFSPDGPPALDAISATIRPGRITGLVGPDGAGKTTLIRLMVGLLSADAGTLTVGSEDALKNPAAIREFTGYMPQRFGLYDDLTVAENLTLYADLRGVVGKLRIERFDSLLSFTGLGPYTSRLAGALSGGMKQKLGLACALLQHPAVLLLDEPSVGVDPLSRRELWAMVKKLAGEGITIVWSTAYLDEAENCDAVLLLNEGRLLFEGDPGDLTNQVRGRSFHIRGLGSGRRQVLARMLAQDKVVDGVIQGANVRLVLKDKKHRPSMAGLPGKLHRVAPRFEDAFVDVLGGGPGGGSALADQMAPIEDDGAAVIEATRLTKRFGTFTAVDAVSISIRRGEVFGLLGPNGAGKSTTFKMLCGLLKPTAGSATIAGLSLRAHSARARRNIGYMAQKFSLYGNLSLRQNLDFFSGVYGLSGAKRRRKIDAMMDIFALAPHAATSADALPLGFKQRLALSCAVMHEPAVLFLDEPTSGVDPITRREFWNHINAMVEKGMTIMVTTHFMDEAEYCDRIAIINQGVEIATGSPDDLKARVAGKDNSDPTLEEAFIALVEAATLKQRAAA